MQKLIAALLLVAAPVWAVVDIAPEEVGEDPGVSGNINVAYSSKTGNTDKDESDVGAKIKYDTNRRSLAFVQGTYERTKSDDVETENELIAHSRFLHKFAGESLYGEAFVQAYQDTFKGIENRWLLGGGLRWRFISFPAVGKLYVGGGAFEEELNYTEEFPEEDDSVTRWNSYLAYTRPLSSNAVFSTIAYYQPTVDSSDDYYTALNAELMVHVAGGLHVTLSYELDRDSRPPEGIKKIDREISTALVWKF